MKRYLFIYPLVIALACLIALLRLTPSADSSPSTVSAAALAETAQVAEQDVGAILRGQVIPAQGKLIVEVLSMSGQVSSLRTDSEGWYSFPSLPSGAYQLRVLDQNKQELVLATGARIRVEPDESLIEHHLSLALSDTGEVMRVGESPEVEAAEALQEASGGEGHITGIVTAAGTEEPIAGMSVRVFRDLDEEPFSPEATAFTDESGFYSVTVPASSYHIEFRQFGSEYVPEWYDNQSSYATADAVTVEDGETLEDINAELEVGGQILGRVTAVDGGDSLQGVTVRAYQSSTSPFATGYTDENGVYSIPGLAAGDYYLKFEAANNSVYLDEYYDDQPTLSEASPISVTLGQTVPGINAALTTGGTITGEVTAVVGGAALQNLSVYVYTDTTSTSYIASGYTDENGFYQILGLPAGDYYLKFDASSSSGYLGEYYNNQSSLAEADPINVQLGETTGDIDAALETGGTITGEVTAVVGGAALENVSVYVYTDTTSTWHVASGYTDENGLYQILGLPAGSYYLKFNAPYNSGYLNEYYNNQSTLAEASPINVALNTEVQIDAALETGGTLNGVVTAVVGGAALENVSVYVYTDTTSTQSIASDRTEVSGTYSIQGLPAGTYYLEFDAPYNSGYINEYYNNQSSLAEASPIDVALNSEIQIDAALETGGTLTGIVTAEADSIALENVRVYVYDSISASDYTGFARTDESGTYEMIGLPPGDYYLYFGAPYGENYLDEYYNNQPTLASADSVNVPLNTVVPVDAALATGGIIVGKVTAADTGLPLEDVRVALHYDQEACDNSDGLDYEYTSATGVYTFTRLATDSYDLTFEPPSYGKSKAYLDDSNADVSVTAGSVTDGDIALQRGGQIMGQVTAADGGEPLADVYVDVYRYDADAGYYRYEGYGRTNANGVYSTTKLTTDNYLLQFDPSSNGPSAIYLEEYYNDQATLTSANEVSVTLGQMTTDIDAVLTRGGQITGRITAEATIAPLEDVYVRVYTSTTSIRSVAFASTDENGVYTTTAVATGNYYLEFEPANWDDAPAADYISEYYNDKSTLATANVVAVTAGDMTSDIDAELTRGGTIMGKVTAQDTGEPLSDVYIELYDSKGNEIAYDWSNYEGEYKLSGLPPGTYYLLFFHETYYLGCSEQIDYSGTYYNEEPDFQSANSVSINGTETVANINAVLERGTYQPPRPNGGVVEVEYRIHLPLLTK